MFFGFLRIVPASADTFFSLSIFSLFVSCGNRTIFYLEVVEKSIP